LLPLHRRVLDVRVPDHAVFVVQIVLAK
jgi:hypothetical protein